MKCVVLAYHNIGRAGIEALRKNGFEISAVFTHQDNPDENIWFGSVAELAGEYDIPVFAPESVNHPVWVNRIRAMKPDYIFSFYYRDMLGGEILSIPSKGAINLHGSLLPKNPVLCDFILQTALDRRYGKTEPLVPLNDTLELNAHNYMEQRLSK